jgi:outer membrane immunogenic protein
MSGCATRPGEITMQYVIRAAAVVVAMAVPLAAQAADLRLKPVYKGPPAAVVYNWTGCYVGGQFGAQWHSWTADVTFPAAAPTVIAERGFTSDGALLSGGQLGCNWQPAGGMFVAGVEADVAGVSGDGFGGQLFRFALPATDHFDATGRFGTQASLRLRLGLTFDRFMLYVASGVTWARLSASTLLVRDGVGAFESSVSNTRDGWNVGIGGEYAFANNVTLGLEYRFTDYGSLDYSVPAGTFPFAFAAFSASAEHLRTQDLRVRFNYLFNGAPVAARY